MTVALNHTIVPASDKVASATFLADILGINPPVRFCPFAVLELDNGVSLDYADATTIDSRHYAFLVDDEQFEPIFERIKAATSYYADPMRSRPGEINTNYGGRGVYFDDPDGHVMEVITRPYGSR